MKSYSQYCGVARTLDLVGGRWTLLLVRDLLLGPRRFSDLLRALPGLTPNLLSERLRHLAAEGLVERRVLGPPAPARLWALTERGRALEPVIMALGAWGSATLERPRDGERTDPGWALLALKRCFRGTSPPFSLALEVIGRRFVFAWSTAGPMKLVEDATQPAAATLLTDPPALGHLLYGGTSLRVLEGKGRVSVRGDRSALSAWLTAFDLRH